MKSGHFGIWSSESHISTLLEQMPLTTLLLGEWHTALLVSAEMGSSYYCSIDTTLSERGRSVSSLLCELPSLTQGSVASLPLDCSESPDSTGTSLIITPPGSLNNASLLLAEVKAQATPPLFTDTIDLPIWLRWKFSSLLGLFWQHLMEVWGISLQIGKSGSLGSPSGRCCWRWE